MAAPRPDPRAVGTTYLDVKGIAAAIHDLKSKSKEGDVNGVWNSILNWVFNPAEGYATNPQAMHTKYGGRRGFSDFHTIEWVEGKRKPFLITQCKRPGIQYRPKMWDDGAEQLRGYLAMQHGQRPVKQRYPVYGILAIGHRVRFFRYHDPSESMNAFRPGRQWALSHGDKDFFDIVEHARLVQSALRFILEHH